MRASLGFVVLGVLFIAGCGSSGPTAGTMEFGTSQSNHTVNHPRTSFGPNDTFAYVAHVQPRAPIPAHTKIHEYFSRIDAKGKMSPVLHDTFALKIPIQKFIVLNSIKVSEFYRAGFSIPGRYQVKLMHGQEQLAAGDFSLK